MMLMLSLSFFAFLRIRILLHVKWPLRLRLIYKYFLRFLELIIYSMYI